MIHYCCVPSRPGSAHAPYQNSTNRTATRWRPCRQVCLLSALLAVCAAAPQLGAQKPIAIVRLDSDISPDGTFTYT